MGNSSDDFSGATVDRYGKTRNNSKRVQVHLENLKTYADANFNFVIFYLRIVLIIVIICLILILFQICFNICRRAMKRQKTKKSELKKSKIVPEHNNLVTDNLNEFSIASEIYCLSKH